MESNLASPKKESAPIKPRYIFLAAVVCYLISFGSRSLVSRGVGESMFDLLDVAFGLAGGIFLVWSIVAALKRKKSKKK